MSRPMPHLVSTAGAVGLDMPALSIGEWDRARTGLWSMSGLAVLALHLAAGLIVALWVPHAVEPPPPAAAMMIDLAPLPTPPAAPPAPKPPEPKPVVKPVEKVVEPPRKPVQPVSRPKPVPVLKPSPSPVPDAAVSLPADPPPQQQAQSAPASSVPAPSAQTASGNGKPTWQGLLLGQLERYKRYPAAARSRRQEGVATVRFVINRKGEVLSVRLERGSGASSLDDEAVALPERAQPLPPPPPEVTGEQIELVVPIQFFLR